VLSLLGVTAIITLAAFNDVEQDSLQQSAIEVHHETSKPAAEVDKTVEPSFSCRGQRLDIVINDDVEPVCMGMLITKHNGSVRSHQVATLAAPQRWLRVEVAGGTVLSAAWGSDVSADFQCQATECNGITISRRDAQGARVMTFEHTTLKSAQASLQLTGRIEVPPETLIELACTDQGVSIVTSDSSSQTFCPQGGAGFEVGDDGTRRYRFTSLDGESIVVATDQAQHITQVRYEGEISLACRSADCGNVRMSAADGEGAHRFNFSGTTLIETESGQSNAVLNGTLILPPL
jgi:hypothetical protein